MIVIRLMGKRQLGELQPYELVITIMISDLASLPMQDTRLPLLLGVIPIVTLLLLKTLILELQVRIPFISDLIDGKPVMLIDDGKLLIKNLKNQKLTVDDLYEEIRENGFLDVDDIRYAILENNGSVSIFPKENLATVKKEDLNIPVKDFSIPKVLFIEGRLVKKSLKELGKDSKWFYQKLKDENAPDITKIFLVVLTSKNELYFEQY